MAKKKRTAAQKRATKRMLAALERKRARKPGKRNRRLRRTRSLKGRVILVEMVPIARKKWGLVDGGPGKPSAITAKRTGYSVSKKEARTYLKKKRR